MIRVIIRLGIFVFIIGLSLYIGVQWKLKEDLNYLISRMSGTVDLDYQSSAMTLTGNVVLREVDLYFRAQDIRMTIDRLEYSSGSILEMAFLKRQIDNQTIPEKLILKIREMIIPLTPSLVKYIASTEKGSVWNVLNASACGNTRYIGINEYFSMGYDYIVFSTEFDFYRDSYSGNLRGEGRLEIEETAEIEFQFNLAGFYQQLEEQKTSELLKEQTLSFEKLQLAIKDKGYNTRKIDYCSVRSQQTAKKFIEQHIKIIDQKLQSVGINMTLAGKRSYNEYLQPSSLLQISVEPQVIFTFADFGYYDEQELRDLLNLKLEINHKTVAKIFNHWALDKFEKIITRDLVSKTESESQSRYESVVVKRSFHLEAISTAKSFIDYKIKVIRDDGKKFEGKLTKIKKDSFYIATQVQAGIVEVAVKIHAIKDFSVYR